ncbi:MAG: efflux RND transporter permease subunit [Rhodobacteraceae bacterium]|nr:efflux RND transporter permease subunit [Paracoccaceae bacterium]
MTGMVDWAAARARMVVAFVILSLGAGWIAYTGLPKEGSPDIDIPALFVSVPFPGISAEDSEKLIVRPLETKLRDLDGLKKMTATAAEGYGGVALEFEFGWNKSATIADVRDRVSQAEGDFPDGADQYSINEINFSQFPIIVVALSGKVPERTLLRVAKDLQSDIEALSPVLEAALTGHRNEMLEVVIDPLKLEAYNVTAGELINVVTNNNQLIAAGEIETANGAFSVKIPAAFDEAQDVYSLPVKVNGDRVITLGELAEIRLTFEDRVGTARYNGETTVALQVVKRKGENLIDTVELVRQVVLKAQAGWPEDLRDSVAVNFAMDQSDEVSGMVTQLEASVLTAIALVMMVVLGALGTRSALLVGFAIPTSFLLCFAILAVMGIAISNIVMFGLILAVGMLVDGAIVVVEYADKRISEGTGPMHAYVEAAKRMFWPIVSSTATTICAFLPMLFWPGVPGEFMGMLPVTLIFVLSASLVVALIYLPVIGGVAGRFSRRLAGASRALRRLGLVPRLALFVFSALMAFASVMQTINPAYLLGPVGEGLPPSAAFLPGMILFLASAIAMSITVSAIKPVPRKKPIKAGYRRNAIGWVIHALTSNPVMPIVTIAAVIGFVGVTFMTFTEKSLGVEFFVDIEPDRAIAYVRARGNMGLEEKDAILREAELEILKIDNVASVFSFAGEGGLNQNTGGATAPRDTIGQVQIELEKWENRTENGRIVLQKIEERLKSIPGVEIEILKADMGPASGKPVNLRLTGTDWQDLLVAAETVNQQFRQTEGLFRIEDTRPLPGIDWQIDVDVEKAGRFGADVVAVGAMVQLVTRGLLLDKMRVDSSDEEIDIRVRLPSQDRLLSTIDTLRVRTQDGLIPMSNFISRQPVKSLGQIDRVDAERYFDVKADIRPGTLNDQGKPMTPDDQIRTITDWLETDQPLPESVAWSFVGDQEEQAESMAFLGQAFIGALGLMFVILLAQFNSVYNSVLVLLAVVLSTTGVLIGMMVMQQPFSVIMTGTGIVALAGIVVNNNIVLIDTYQEYAAYMPRQTAIVRTVEARLRPVLLTTITTMAGLAPMMFGISVDFFNGGYTIDAPTALWWKQLATAVVFGLGIATVLTLVFTPSLLALRIWIGAGAYRGSAMVKALSMGRESRAARDLALARASRRTRPPELTWDDYAVAPKAEQAGETETPREADSGLKAAE